MVQGIDRSPETRMRTRTIDYRRPTSWLAVLVTLAGVGAAGAPVRAQSGLVDRVITVERILASGYGGELTLVGAPHGDVSVVGWRGQAISLVARISISAPTQQDIDKLASIIGMVVDESGPVIAVETAGPHDKKTLKAAKNFPKALTKMPWRVDYTVRVPEYTSVQLGVVDGNAEVADVNGAVAITSLRGSVTVRNVGGFTKVTAGEGNVTLATVDRTWRGAGTDVVAAHGDIKLQAPAEFGALLDAKAANGIHFLGARVSDEGQEVRGTIGRGGSRLALVAHAGSITVHLVTRAETDDSREPAQVFERPKPPG
jgi:hypothetical protein